MKSSTYDLTTQFFEEDFTGHLSWNSLGRRILRAAAQHAQERDFELVEKDGHTYLWVLSRMVIEMQRMPLTLEKATIETWLRSQYRYFTDRCFEINDASGKTIGRVLTTWALMDSETREPADIQAILGEQLNPFIDPVRPFSVERGPKIRLQRAEPVGQRQVYYSDLDKNNHLNSIRYIDYALDTLPKEKLASVHPRRIDIAYSHECYHNDQVNILSEQHSLLETRYTFLNPRQQIAALCAIHF